MPVMISFVIAFFLALLTQSRQRSQCRRPVQRFQHPGQTRCAKTLVVGRKRDVELSFSSQEPEGMVRLVELSFTEIAVTGAGTSDLKAVEASRLLFLSGSMVSKTSRRRSIETRQDVALSDGPLWQPRGRDMPRGKAWAPLNSPLEAWINSGRWKRNKDFNEDSIYDGP